MVKPRAASAPRPNVSRFAKVIPMGLSNALGTAMSGLRTTQSSVEIVSQNIANSTTEGYTRKLHDQEYLDANGSNFVRSLEATRSLDTMLQRSVRLESARMAQYDARDGLQGQLGLLFGQPGSEIALDTMYNDVVEALEALITTPESAGARAEVLSQAGGFAARLNQMSDGVQELRRQAEVGIAEGVREANDALDELERLDRQIVMESGMGRADADLLDQRDMAINRLNALIAVRAVPKDNGGVSVMTTGGVMLHDIRAVDLSFDGRHSVGAQQLYSRDDAERGVGTITAGMPDGTKLDLLSFDAIRGGRLAGLVEMRDTDLVEAQAQLDELAHALAKATQTSDAVVTQRTDAPATADVGWTPAYTLQSLDLSGLAGGDEIKISYGGTHYTFIADATVAGGSALDGTRTTRLGDTVVSLDPTETTADWAGDIAAALGITLDNAVTPANLPAGSADTTLALAGDTLRVFDPAGGSNVTAFSGTIAAPSQTRVGLALFTDGNTTYTDAPTAGFEQRLGFSGRIGVNAELTDDPAGLIKFSSTPGAPGYLQGDPTRAEHLADAFDSITQAFRPAGGVGGRENPFEGTPSDYIRAVISSQGARTANEARRAESQELVTQSLVERSERVSGVDIDQEMADLLDLQNIYNANSQVIRVVQELMDQLMNAVR